MIDVVIALEELLLQMGIKAALDASDDCRAVGTVGNVNHVDQEVRRMGPNVLLLDVHFQRRDRDLIPRLVRNHPGLKVLVLVDHSDEECSIRALLADPAGFRFSEEALEHLDECCLTSLRSSARGCVPRTIDPPHLLHAIRTIAGGEIAAAPWLSALVSGGGSSVRIGGPAPISARELEVIALVADGKGNKEIARALGIREQTVKNHLASIMTKLGVKSRLEVGLHAVRKNLGQPASLSGEAPRKG
jgi:DNA-binding NarL/FixJ family response regulator